VVVVVVVMVHGHFWISRSSGSILQRFGFKLLVRASRVAKARSIAILVVFHGHFWTSGSVLQRFGFKLLVRASRVAKIL